MNPPKKNLHLMGSSQPNSAQGTLTYRIFPRIVMVFNLSNPIAMDDETSGAVKSQLPLAESETHRLSLMAQLRQTQYANEQFHAREWNPTQSWSELSRHKADLEQARLDPIHGITHRVDLEASKSPGPRKGQSQGRKLSHPKEPNSNRRSKSKSKKRIPEPWSKTYVAPQAQKEEPHAKAL